MHWLKHVVREWTAEAVRTTESPLEARFALAFREAAARMFLEGHPRFALRLRPQVWVDAPSGACYRLDFAVEPLDAWLRDVLVAQGRELRVGIELDGHDFHERTREQVIARNRRDRDLAALGWRVLHFSGSEVYRNPMQAAVEALEAGADALDTAKALLPHRF